MTKIKRIVLQPEYMKSFKCIGPSCEDSCCIGWNVDLDKATYLKYKKLKNIEFRSVFDKSINRKHNKKSNESYGKIKMNKEKGCPFLDTKKLCKIHANLGEEFLSDTCSLYPRNISKIDGKFEQSATMSCPEAARLALLNSQGIALEHIEESVPQRDKVHQILDTEGHLHIKRPQRQFWDIRIFSLSLLQNRNYSLADRLVLLGMAYRRIENYTKKGQAKDIPLMLSNIEEIIEKGEISKELESIPLRTDIQMKMAKALTDKKIEAGAQNDRYLECFRETLLGLGYTEGEPIENIVGTYEKNFEQYLSPFLKEKEYILENYLVNEYFREMMPFGEYKSIWDSYIFLCVLYSMTKLHLIGISGHHQEMNDEIIIKFIQSFSKLVLHNNSYIQGVVSLLKENRYSSLAYMSILVKN